MKIILDHFKATADLLKIAKIWKIKRRWFESNKSLKKRILAIMKEAREAL